MKVTALGGQVGNGGKTTINLSRPYRALFELTGSSDMLFHRYDVDAVEAKRVAAKGSAAKRETDIEQLLYRTEKGNIGLPGEYVRQSVIMAAKFCQDPRSPRKSAMDIVKAAVLSLTTIADLGVSEPHYEHKCRVCVQRAAIPRVRPAIKSGWKAEMIFLVNLPEYVSPSFLNKLLVDAGRLIGVADFRPTFGRFQVTRFEVLGED